MTKRGNENKAAQHHLIMQNDKYGRELRTAEEASHLQVLHKLNEEVELQLQLLKPPRHRRQDHVDNVSAT